MKKYDELTDIKPIKSLCAIKFDLTDAERADIYYRAYRGPAAYGKNEGELNRRYVRLVAEAVRRKRKRIMARLAARDAAEERRTANGL